LIVAVFTGPRKVRLCITNPEFNIGSNRFSGAQHCLPGRLFFVLFLLRQSAPSSTLPSAPALFGEFPATFLQERLRRHRQMQVLRIWLVLLSSVELTTPANSLLVIHRTPLFPGLTGAEICSVLFSIAK